MGRCGALWVLRRDVRRADSLPTGRAIDWEKAARWTRAKGARRVAKARMADMIVVLLLGGGLCGATFGVLRGFVGGSVGAIKRAILCVDWGSRAIDLVE